MRDGSKSNGTQDDEPSLAGCLCGAFPFSLPAQPGERLLKIFANATFTFFSTILFLSKILTDSTNLTSPQ